MDGLLLALALVCAVVNSLGIFGGRQTLRDQSPDDREARATAWYLIVRCVAMVVAALIGAAAVAFAWAWEVSGWIFAIAAITAIVQLFDVPVWLSRRRRGSAAVAGGLVVAVIALGALALGLS
ncbi:hypothetical protein [Microbacterium sp. LWH3-1.2]|uniref:hypothetical protein n=1 Tax=Microbacterium sp. LWH3-1.2 TaxID=3135256 RepID=UPI0034277120